MQVNEEKDTQSNRAESPLNRAGASRFVCVKCDAPVTPMGNAGHWKREHPGHAPLKWKRVV